MIFSPRSRSTISLLRRKYQLLTTCTHSHHWATRSSPCRTTLCHTASYRKTQSSSWCLLHESIIRPSASRIPSAWWPRRSRPRFELSPISSFGISFFPGLSGADRLRHPFCVTTYFLLARSLSHFSTTVFTASGSFCATCP